MERLNLLLKSDMLKADVNLLGSKSISNRLLIMNHLAGANAKFENLSTSDDTMRLQKSLKQIENCSSSRIPLIVDAGNAGTVFRFLTAYLSIKQGKWLLNGTERMKNRPIGELVDSLMDLGADIHYPQKESYPPLLIEGVDLKGDVVEVNASKSSQFVSALMMIAPYFEEGLTIKLKKKPVSVSYIEMTASLMKGLGIGVEMNDKAIKIEPGNYQLEDTYIEPDWSSASYWYEIAALSKNAEIFLPGFRKNSVQGDAICAELFEKLGVKTKFKEDGIRLQSIGKTIDIFEHDFTNHPDLVPAIMATCAAKQVPANFYGVAHLKYKESDRIKSLEIELSKIGASLNKIKGGYSLLPSQSIDIKKELVFDTYDDHRMAMCLAPLVMIYKKVEINNSEVVVKSYPSFWEDIKKTGLADVEKL